MPGTSVEGIQRAEAENRPLDVEDVQRNSVNSTVQRVFSECQRTASAHRRNVLVLADLQRESPETFVISFTECLNQILLVYKREPSVERVVAFIALACSLPQTSNTGGLGDEFAVNLIRYLINFSNAKDKAVRMRVVQLVGLLLRGLESEEAVDDSLWDDLEARLLARAYDKLPSIRSFAVTALERLQDPSTASDPVIVTCLSVMGADTSKEVRKAALRSIITCPLAVEAIIARTHDVSEDVQVCAFQQLGDKIPFKMLSTTQRAEILKSGLRSRSGAVRKACQTLLFGPWLQANEERVAHLVQLLDPEEFEPIVADSLRLMYRDTKEEYTKNCSLTKEGHSSLYFMVDLEELSSPNALTVEKSIMLRVRCQVCAEQNNSSLDELIPDILSFCELLETHSIVYMNLVEERESEEVDPDSPEAAAMDESILRQDFIIHQLLSIACVLDFKHDQVGQRKLVELITQLVTFSGTEPETVDSALNVLRSAIPSESEFSRHAISTVSEIQCPLSEGNTGETEEVDNSGELEQLAEEVEKLRRAQEQFIELGKEEEAEEILAAMQEVESRVRALEKGSQPPPVTSLDLWRVLRCLQIISALLRFSRRSALLAEAESLFDNFILPTIQSRTWQIRKESVRCLGLYCSKELKSAQELMAIFKAFVEEKAEKEEIRVVALQAIVDIILSLGIKAETGKTPNELVEESESEAEDHDEAKEMNHKQNLLTQFLLATLDDSSEVVRCTTAEGLAKLFITGRLYDPRVLQCMIALYFHPKSVSDNRLRQCLSVFFPTYAQLSKRNRETIQLIALPMIRAMLSPLATEDLKSVDFEQVVQFFFYLLMAPQSHEESNEETVSTLHGEFTLGILGEMAVSPQSPNLRAMSKSLGLVEVDLLSNEELKALVVVLDETLRSEIIDKVVIRQLQKWRETLIAADDEPEKNIDAQIAGDLISTMEARAVEVSQLQSKYASRRESSRASRRSHRHEVVKKEAESSAEEEESDEDEEEESDGGEESSIDDKEDPCNSKTNMDEIDQLLDSSSDEDSD